ncbi:hypothetical protein DPMN_193047 [Dreissena polymorpha]|uniref:Uncharacterized protein n=1 Tax=Dreissena polymorpha TaxID=45954 RepID=A0A9D3Y0Q2_DREPO|nr:hypothetical protein DPMN_193047 [Dreissena polymorpha]
MPYQHKSRALLQFSNIPRRRRTTLLIGQGHALYGWLKVAQDLMNRKDSQDRAVCPANKTW